ncbi:MAG TPA: prolyl oligopeptidase family serine peptidase [Thermoanaerobaculia bacterium]|nr:prolyl oligopeptidase family serine peptidase [Thermoanaerobaculia bacterium]
MRKALIVTFVSLVIAISALAQVPENLVVESVPALPRDLVDRLYPYFETRSAILNNWHPTRREMLITTRFGDTTQLHYVNAPGAARKQLTFFADRVGGGSFRPKAGDIIVFSKDVGGGEFFQYYRYSPADGTTTLLTDGKSRNTGLQWSTSGQWMAYSSTKRNGRDTDIHVMNPADPQTDRVLVQVEGGGWFAVDWSPDDKHLIVGQYIAADESYLYLADAKTGQKRLLTPKGGEKIAYTGARFSPDGKTIYFVSDKGAEFQRLGRMEVASGRQTILTPNLNWDVDEFDLSPDGKWIAYIANEDAIGVLHLLDTTTGREVPAPKLPPGIPFNLEFHQNGRDLGLNLNSWTSPSDVYSVDVTTGKLERWTESETGGLNNARNAAPEFIRLKSFDNLPVSGFIYRPDAARFPGKRPVIINIHGGPEGQARPNYLSSTNFLINELGIAVLYPNVRGSSGYGKTFLTLDNAMKREDSVRDIATFLDWVETDARLASDRIALTGGSYGGYMVLASMTHFGDRVRAAVDVVGISNFISFLQNTQDYRRDLRRAEYGDERDPAMRAFFEKIAPLNNVGKITKPMFIVQGFNDPRVPHTEARQMVDALKQNDVPVWFLMAKDEGHGFAKKKNQVYQAAATILFYQQHLLN